MKVPVNRILLCKNEFKSTHYNCILRVITVRNSSCGKVMFSQVSVCPRGVYNPLPVGRHPPLCRQTATAADGTHPTGVHSCFLSVFSTCRLKYKQPVTCVLSEREICVAHPLIPNSPVKDKVMRCTEVTKYMLSRDVSSCMSDLSLHGVQDTLTSLFRLDSKKSALLSTSYTFLYIW